MKAFEDLKESTKKDIIIDGLMSPKDVYLLVSKPKVGKSCSVTIDVKLLYIKKAISLVKCNY